MDTTASDATPEPQVVFRGKKRKTYRQRTEPADDIVRPTTVAESESLSQDTSAPETTQAIAPAPAPTPTPAAAQSEDTEEDEKGLSVAEVLRLRNARKSRIGGVKFGGANTTSNDAAAVGIGTGIGSGADALDELSLMIREEEGKAVDVAAGVKKRFAPQTGMAAEIVNKHM